MSLKKYDLFEQKIDGNAVSCTVSFLNRRAVSITLNEPFKCSFGRSIPKEEMEEKPLATKVDGEYVTTEAGDSLARKIHRILYREACYLVDNKEKVKAMIEALLSKTAGPNWRLQEEFFPDIHHIEMDVEFLDMFSQKFLGNDYDVLGAFFPTFLKDPKALKLKAGSSISVMKDGETIHGRVDVLTRMAVRVSITYPIGCSASRYADQARFAEKIEGVCIGNDEGVSVARELLVKLHEQAVYLMEHKKEMGLFICEYLAVKEYKTDRLRVLTMKEIEEYKQLKDELDNLLPTMREHFFPTITDLEMDEAFLKRYSENVLGALFNSDRTPVNK